MTDLLDRGTGEGEGCWCRAGGYLDIRAWGINTNTKTPLNNITLLFESSKQIVTLKEILAKPRAAIQTPVPVTI